MAFVLDITAPAHRAAPRTGLLATVARMMRLRRERLDLAQLSDAQLRDIGVSREEASQEAAKPVWDAPTHWHR